ncbi:phenylalanine--tRNA ligase subunit beta [Candidatus Kaiserbacteria bacterium]|nr:phenylalanine--tRNA ligase subunit beta [Candidatus Kaiserbacteria bacterium]
MKVLHEWIAEYLGEKTPTPEKIEELLTFHAFEIEGVEGDVIDVDVLPNRSSDCLCHRGIARELAALLDTKLVKDPLREEITLSETDTVEARITDEKGCRRMGLVRMEGVEIKESPEWLKKRLEALGQRSINNVVDATNYVMLSLGQPLHAYDGSKLSGGSLGVRYALEGEKIVTLSDDEYELSSDIQVIEDADGTALGIAGIKGGKHAEVDTNTTDIILEAANFDPVITRKASQKLRLQTDASKRFENNPSPELIPYALQETANLIKEIAGGEIIGWTDTYPVKQEEVSTTLSVERANRLLGLSLTTDDVAGILSRLGIAYTQDGDTFSVTSPWERTDLHIEEDYIEEVGRVYGYNHVESVVPEKTALAEVNPRQYYSEKIRKTLLDLGFSEVITSSFRKKDKVKLLNALASDKGYLRSTLSKNITEALDKNMPYVDLIGTQDVRVFEVGTVFEKGDGTVEEHFALSWGVRTKQTGYTPKDDTPVQEAQKALEEVLGVELKVSMEKGVAEMDLSALLSKLPQPEAYEPFEKTPDVTYKPFSVYPHVSRDIALWTEGVSADDVEEVLRSEAGDLLVRISLFDEFSKDGKTSYAFRLVFQSTEGTLTDEEVNPIMERINVVAAEKGWEVR